MKKAIMMDPRDNVATALATLGPGEEVEIISTRREEVKRVTARGSLPLGHKIALEPLAKGDRVVKYGTMIGRALEDIPTGEYVHIHNVGSERFPLTEHMRGAK
jgi:hypothetical protein